MRKISVIIPVYNGEAFVGQCIQSLAAQTYQDWEALVIDDGSTDRSLALCGELARADGRIRVFHQENKGVSAARNHGLDLAQGEYIFFLDSDDAIHPLLLEEMMRQVEEHQVEMAFCGCAKLDDRQLEEALRGASPGDGRPQWTVWDGAESERQFHMAQIIDLRGVSGLASRELVGQLRFDEDSAHGEDTLFKYSLFRQRVKTAYSAQRWYYYRMHAQSITHCGSWEGEADRYNNIIRIRDSEYRNGRQEYAVEWERLLMVEMRRSYAAYREAGRRDSCGQVKAAAARECGHPLFRPSGLARRGLFHLCFRCYPVYAQVVKAAPLVWALKERFKQRLRR